MNRDTLNMFIKAAFDMPAYIPKSEREAEQLIPSPWDVMQAKSGSEEGNPSRRPLTGVSAVDAFTASLEKAGAYWKLGAKGAFTDTKKKLIALPSLSLFKNREGLISTLVHEGVHWAGAYGPHKATFHSRNEPIEEIVTETTKEMLLAEWGLVDPARDNNSRDYVANWFSAEINKMDVWMASMLGGRVQPITPRDKYTVASIANQVEERYNDVQYFLNKG